MFTNVREQRVKRGRNKKTVVNPEHWSLYWRTRISCSKDVCLLTVCQVLPTAAVAVNASRVFPRDLVFCCFWSDDFSFGTLLMKCLKWAKSTVKNMNPTSKEDDYVSTWSGDRNLIDNFGTRGGGGRVTAAATRALSILKYENMRSLCIFSTMRWQECFAH